MWWVEILDIEDGCFWSTWAIDSQKVKDSDPALYAISDEESTCLRETYEKAEAEEKARQFRALPKVAEVHLVQVFQRRPGESMWEPLWDADKERLGC